MPPHMSAKGCLAVVGILAVAGGGVGGWFVLRAKQVQASVDALEKFHPPGDWAEFTMSAKAAAPIRAVKAHGAAAVKGLAHVLEGPAGPARQGAMVALGEMNEPTAVGSLVKTLQGDDAAEAAAAAYALSRFKTTPPEVAALLKRSPTSQVRKNVYWALARSSDKESNRIVARGIEDPEGDVRYFAVQALATIRGKSATAALVNSLKDSDRTVASAAADALAAREADVPRDDVRALAQSGPAATRARAISVLARVGDGNGRPVAIAAAQDPDAEVAAAGAALLATCRAKEEGARLVALLERPEKEVVAAAERALRDLKEAGVQVPEEELFRLLEAQSVATRTAAAGLIAYLDLDVKKKMGKEPWVIVEKPAVPRLLACLKQGDEDLATAAAGALRSFEQRSNFRNTSSIAGQGWEPWWEQVRFEKATIDKIQADWDRAVEIIRSGDKPKLKEAQELLGNCEKAYQVLIDDKKSKSHYEHGDFGLVEIRNTVVLVRKSRVND